METAELVRQENTQVAHVPQEDPGGIMAVIARAAADPSVNVEKMQALLNMKLQLDARNAEIEFNAALARLMTKLPRIEKNGVIPDNNGVARSTFARYEDIMLVIQPLLSVEGFSISFRTEEPLAGHVRVIGTLAHHMGYSRDSSVTVPIVAPPRASGTQAVGSSVSYGKRYVVVNLLNIVTVGEDNDGRDVETITEDQCMTLETLIQDTKADKSKFLRWAGVETLDQILVRNFQTAVKALEARKRQ